MTATDELRRMLDERGVEWRERQWVAAEGKVTHCPHLKEAKR